ncbi:DUF1109 family protein, partial [bacterium]|nr:DUF1109 family protein [bacterium]
MSLVSMSQRRITRHAVTANHNDITVRKHRPDYIIALLALVLLALGFVVVYAISPGIASARQVSEQYLLSKQIIAIFLGIATFLIFSVIPYRAWRQSIAVLVLFAGLLTIGALLTPVNAQYPAHRWIRFSGLSFQTVEFLKLTLVLWCAHFISMRALRGELSD